MQAEQLPPPSRSRVPARRIWPWVAAAAGYTALALVLLWPLARNAGSVVTRPGSDVLLTSWIAWWNVQMLPLTRSWWNAPIFYPGEGAMAFSEILLGQLPLTAPVVWLSGNPILANNVAVVLSFPLCALAAHALAFALTRRHDAAALAGLAFGFGAIKANHVGHIQTLSFYWAPIALLCLHRYLRGARPAWWITAFAAAVLLQLLCNGHTLFQLPLLVLAWIVWFPATIRQRAAVLASLGAGLLPMVPVLLRYREIHAHYGLTRSITDVRAFSADVATLFQAHPENVLLGGVISAGSSAAFFPGITVAALLVTAVIVAVRRRTPMPVRVSWDRVILLVIAILAAAAALSPLVAEPWAIGPLTVSEPHKPLSIAIVAALAYFARGPRWQHVWRSRSATAFYAVSAAFFFVLSFGPEPRLWGEQVFYQAPYTLLMRLPGFHSIRAPDRMTLTAILCLAVVIGLTYARWADALGRGRRLVALALCAGLALDGWFRIYVEPVPTAGPDVQWGDAVALVELPLDPDTETAAMFRSMRPGPPLVNGASGYDPLHYTMLRASVEAGEIGIIQTLGLDGPLGVAIDRTSSDHERLERGVAALDGATRLSESSAWVTYRVPSLPPPSVMLGPAAGLARVITEASPGDAGRMIDGQIDTAWLAPEDGGEQTVLVELRHAAQVAAVRLQARPGRSWSLPSVLSVDTSLDGTVWTQVWSGTTFPARARAALQDPTGAPLIVTFDRGTARVVRLRGRRTGIDAGWEIAELSVHQPH
jgi:hypothetical protein